MARGSNARLSLGRLWSSVPLPPSEHRAAVVDSSAQVGAQVIALLALALQGAPPPLLPPPTPAGRLYTSKELHIGLREHIFASPYEVASGFTLQISWLHLL